MRSLCTALKNVRDRFRPGAARIVAGMVAVLSGGCAVFTSSSLAPKSMPLTIGTLSSRPQWQIEESLQDPDVYRIRSQVDDEEAFMTALRTCNVRAGTSTSALTRELLVGMREIRIERQVRLESDNDHALFSLLRARLDEQPIMVAAFSRKSEGCISDYVIWSGSLHGKSFWNFFHEGEDTALIALASDLGLWN